MAERCDRCYVVFVRDAQHDFDIVAVHGGDPARSEPMIPSGKEELVGHDAGVLNVSAGTRILM